MSQQNGGSHYNSRVYSENADESQDVYMEGEEYVDEYEEEYVQLADGSLVAASSTTENQTAAFSVSETYPPRVHNQPAAPSHTIPSVTARRTQSVYRVVRNEDIPRQTPQSYKYTKPAAPPALREDKNVYQMHSQPNLHTAYHVIQQPSVSYAYESRPSSSPSTNGSFQQAYQFAQQKSYDVKPLTKTSKRKVMAGQRKPCNCTKSACLKLYCDCFANGEFCRDCNCKDCHNNLEFEVERTKAIKQSLERNPNAFKPKIGVSKPIGASPQDVERLHQKGCHCKKSGCLKNYCECYEAKVPCTDRCKCKGCQNTESDRAIRFKEKLPGTSLLGALSGGALSATAAKMRTGHASDSDSDNDPDSNDPRGYPWFYMTDEVIDAATMCMVAQAEEALIKVEPDTEEMERLVLREFGRCLEMIITSAGAAGPSL